MHMVVVQIPQRLLVVIPVVLVFINIRPQHDERCVVVPLYLTFRRRMVRRGEDMRYPQYPEDVMEELGRKRSSTV